MASALRLFAAALLLGLVAIAAAQPRPPPRPKPPSPRPPPPRPKPPSPRPPPSPNPKPPSPKPPSPKPPSPKPPSPKPPSPRPPPPKPSPPPPAGDLALLTRSGYNYVLLASGATTTKSYTDAQTACKAINGNAFWFDTTDELKAVTDALGAQSNKIGLTDIWTALQYNASKKQFSWAFSGAVVALNFINQLPWVSTYDINDPYLSYNEWQVINPSGVPVGAVMYKRSLASMSGDTCQVLCKVPLPASPPPSPAPPSPSPPTSTCKDLQQPCTVNSDCCSLACNHASPGDPALTCVPPYSDDGRRRRRMLEA